MDTSILSHQDIIKLRSETKGTAKTTHFNNAGSSLPPDVVVETMTAYLEEEAIMGGYETEAKYKEQLDAVYMSIAKLINAEKEEIAIVENASTAWILAFYGMDLKEGDEVITCEMEYVTNVIALLHAEKTKGIKVKVIPNDQAGNFSMSAFKEAISPQTKLIAITHIAATAGGIMPIAEIGKIARQHCIFYLVDACQSIGQVPIDVKDISCDMLAVTGRKYLRAPRGTGFLFVKKEIQNKMKLLFMDGFTVGSGIVSNFKVRDDARRFELYEKNRALTLGLGKAVDYALEIGVDRIWQRIKYLSMIMRNSLRDIDNITVHDIGDQQCGIVTFSVNGIESTVVKSKLAESRINVSVGLARSTQYYMEKNNLSSVVRASIHYYNTEDEINKCCRVLLSTASIKELTEVV